MGSAGRWIRSTGKRRRAAGLCIPMGPIIHNEEVTADLERKGVRGDRFPAGSRTAVFGNRDYPVSRRARAPSRRNWRPLGLTVVDATCPFLKKIHRLVQEYSGRRVLYDHHRQRTAPGSPGGSSAGLRIRNGQRWSIRRKKRRNWIWTAKKRYVLWPRLHFITRNFKI